MFLFCFFYRLLHEDEIRREELGEDGEMMDEFYAKIADFCSLTAE